MSRDKKKIALGICFILFSFIVMFIPKDAGCEEQQCKCNTEKITNVKGIDYRRIDLKRVIPFMSTDVAIFLQDFEDVMTTEEKLAYNKFLHHYIEAAIQLKNFANAVMIEEITQNKKIDTNK